MSEPAQIATVTLEQPIKREGGDVTEVKLRKPNAGELRGLSLVDVVKLEIDAVIKLVPRISLPFVAEQELHQLSPADLFAISTEIANFFLPKGTRQESLGA